jgi:hypothetical protein
MRLLLLVVLLVCVNTSIHWTRWPVGWSLSHLQFGWRRQLQMAIQMVMLHVPLAQPGVRLGTYLEAGTLVVVSTHSNIKNNNNTTTIGRA